MTAPRKAAASRAAAVGAVSMSVVSACAATFVTRNLTYDRRESSLLASSGVTSRSVTMPDGAVIGYGEGPPGGAPLLLIPGQQVSWTDYASVLGALSDNWHVVAVDCFGHGGSTKGPAHYPALRQTTALTWFIESVVGTPAVVAGHSSGGLLAARLAADSPDLVRAVLIEDAPFFATEPDRAPGTFAWLDGFRPMHEFLATRHDASMTWTRHWVRHSHLRTLFGDKGWTRLVRDPVERRLDRDPHRIPRLWWLPPTMNRALARTACLQDGTGDYDLRYGEMFYDNTWFDGFDQTETLTRVRAPATLLHATVHEQDGVLLGAMTHDDARRAHVLMPDCLLVDRIPAGHDIHRQRPALFVDSINALSGRIR
ncbi:alpha/beta hydrolase [Gordonia alkanivorans]|uniref:alpha/beta hydrolase n=1 Tax=Gordonia alkanivorans TaxID=84096 RepID=UPI00244C9DDE|nr:alpha/beta hydrolase [Gordonia alkanivorans]MDH3044210.1 alpha/beta hydrolase [Gordonia alkanivorans]